MTIDLPTSPSTDLVKLNDHYSFPKEHLIDHHTAEQRAAFHKTGVCYRAPAIHRAIGATRARPGLVLTGFAALSLYGLEFFVDACDTVLMGTNISTSHKAGPTQPRIVRGTVPEVWQIQCGGQDMSVASPPLAVVQALKDIRRGINGWHTVPIPGHKAEFIRAIQLVDATRHHLRIDPLDVLGASRGHIALDWIIDVLVQSSALAESPKETEMRLIAHRIAAKYGLDLQEQVPIKENGHWVTRLDLGLTDPVTGQKFGLMYDGVHHWDRHQRQKDSRINLGMTLQGWIPMRFGSGTLGTMYQQLDAYFAATIGDRAAS